MPSLVAKHTTEVANAMNWKTVDVVNVELSTPVFDQFDFETVCHRVSLTKLSISEPETSVMRVVNESWC